VLDHLWAGWRASYVKTIDQIPEEACLFCQLAAEPDERGLILERDDLAYSVLNRFPYTTGHLMVTPIRHVGAMADISPHEQEAMWRLLVRAESALDRAMAPSGFNLGANLGRVAGAGVPGHFHLHLVPRWPGDTNFMSTTAGTRVLPEALQDTWRNVRQALEQPDTQRSGAES
jgi:ATP adenylyltransferase